MRAVFVFALLALTFSAVFAEETCLDLANKLQVGGGESGEEGHTHRARAFAIGADVLSSPLSFWSRGLGLGGDRLHVRYPERIGHTLAYRTSNQLAALAGRGWRGGGRAPVPICGG